MHKKFVLNIIARILMIVSFVLFFPLIWACIDNVMSQEVQAFVMTILLGLLCSAIILKKVPIEKKDFSRLNAKDGLAIVGLSWLGLSFFGALPFALSGEVLSFTDAVFETASGFTTTGASIMTDIESLPRGILFWRSLTHWLGGMGIIVLSLALLPALGKNAYALYKAEAPGVTVDKIEPRMKETAKILWTVYFLLTFSETILLMFCGMSLFDSLCHTFGTMATGGFSTKNASMAAYGPAAQWVVIVFMFLAGANFMLHFQAMRGRFRSYLKNEEFQYYAILTFGFIALFTFVLKQQGLSLSPLRDAAFQVLSILTTTGYATTDFDLWPHALRFLLVCLMFIGGCGGSTGGGMKVVRFFMTIKIAIRSVVQVILPNAVLPIKFNNARCPSGLVLSVASYFIIFILLFFAGAIALLLTEGCDIVTAFTASIAALSNIGPGLARVGATQNYAWVSHPGKWTLIFLMLAGRLELYSILILMLPATWRK